MLLHAAQKVCSRARGGAKALVVGPQAKQLLPLRALQRVGRLVALGRVAAGYPLGAHLFRVFYRVYQVYLEYQPDCVQLYVCACACIASVPINRRCVDQPLTPCT